MKKTIDITVSEAFASPKLFAPFFAGSSWDTWKAVIKAMFGEPLNAAELALFRAVAERDPPVRSRARDGGRCRSRRRQRQYRHRHRCRHGCELRSAPLRPGERAVVMLLAVDREQAKIAFNYIAALFREVSGLGQAGPARH